MAYFHTTVLDNQIKALPTISTASGSVATFDTDLTENLVECVCNIPSGKSAISVIACGKNIVDIRNVTSDRNINVLNYNISSTCFISLHKSDDFEATSNVWEVRVTLNDDTMQYAFPNFVTGTGIINATPENPIKLITCRYVNITSGSYDVQLEYGNQATAYSPFNGGSYTINLGETLSANGTYNTVNGVLTRSDTTTKQLNSCPIVTLNSETNHIYNNCGDTNVKYLLSVGKKIS